ncbi:MAG: AtpZ/AtpI family protein [Erysipelotrichales bacterium]|nr:AtpZ/AtpI family protein [Erysipelotrichales bacterium]
MLKDLLFALDLGLRVIGSFLICTFIGLKLDEYFQSQPVCILLGIILAFIYVIKLLLGVGKNE